MRWCLLPYIIISLNNLCHASSALLRFPALFALSPPKNHNSLLVSTSTRSSQLLQRRHHRVPAFIDNSRRKASSFDTLAKMTSLSNNDDGSRAHQDELSDAEAYHDMVSAAVDFTSVYERNGIITAIRSVRDIDTNSRRRFLYSIPIKSTNDENPPFIPPPVELPAKIKARIPSPSGSKIAMLMLVQEDHGISSDGSDHNKRWVFEIWTDNGHRLANRIVLPSEKHGPVCTDFAWFGGISWSPDESTLVYTAEVTKPSTSSFFTTPSSKSDEKSTILGGEYTLGVGKSEDWGEKYGTTALLALFCLNVETGKIGFVENAPGSSKLKDITTTEGGYVLGQPVFSPCGKSVVYTGWDAGEGGEMPRRLGAIYCFQRPCKIYSSSVNELLEELANPNVEDDDKATSTNDTPYVCITPNDRLARSPRFSEADGDTAKLAFLCNTNGFDTHGGCMALHLREWDMATRSVADMERKVVVDVVRLPGETGDDTEVAGIKFPGLFLNQLPTECFSPDGKNIITTTEWGSKNTIVRISLEDRTIFPIDLQDDENSNGATADQFLGFAGSTGLIITQSEANRPTILGIFNPTHGKWKIPLPPISSTSFSSLKPEACFKPGTGFSYQISNIQPDHGDVKVPVGSILLVPDNVRKDEKLPLIVVPHGGPHTCMSTAYFPSYGFMCKQGRYAILHVNFRGSTGFGQAALESLAGNAGALDVLDVVAATRAVIDAGVADPNRVGICGGSHGGFLAGHCIGQHPELFKVAAMRNPCTNIASMVTATDIPDWCYIEALGLGKYNYSDFMTPSKEELDVMWDKSPIAHFQHVKAPTLMALGMKDKRVPPSQGIEYYHALRAKGVPTKLLVYDDCDHAIDLVISEADHWINIKQWFDQHL